MNHSYRDFSQVPAADDYVPPTQTADMTFAQTVHFILSQSTTTTNGAKQDDDFSHCITWLPHGRAFKVINPVLFEQTVCPRFFGHGRYSSFLRQLNNHGFKHLSKGVDRNSYYHEFMLRNRFHLCQYMPLVKDSRRLIADPDNEPDFYQMSFRHPLTPSLETVKAPKAAAATVSSAVLSSPVARDGLPNSPIRPDPIAFGSAPVSQFALSRLLVHHHQQQQRLHQYQLATATTPIALPPILPTEEELPLVLLALLRYHR
jgi:hypothetical protein